MNRPCNRVQSSRILGAVFPVLLAWTTTLIWGASPEIRQAPRGTDRVEGEVLVRWRTRPTASELSALGVGHSLAIVDAQRIVLSGIGTDAALDSLRKNPNVLWAQPNYRYHALQCVPAEPFYATDQTWEMAQIHAPQGWGLFPNCPTTPPGGAAITVALVDTGLDFSHPDLAAAAVPGWDYIHGDADASDDEGHGTFVAGLIAASWNNQGMAGVAGGVRILPMKVLDSGGNGTSDSVVQGILGAVSGGAKIINLSLGGGGFGDAEQQALDTAISAGLIVVAASGNDGGAVLYPAAYPPVVSVGATDPTGNVAWYSNRGENLDLVAPGGGGAAGFNSSIDMFSAAWSGAPSAYFPRRGPGVPDNEYCSGAGTSYATPLVSAAMALVWSLYPQWTASQVQDRVISSTDDLGTPGWDTTYGYGRLNLERALAPQSGPNPFLQTGKSTKGSNPYYPNPNPFYPESDGTVNLTVDLDRPQPVELMIYDSAGALVLHKTFSPSELNSNSARPQFQSYYVSWDGRNSRGRWVVTGVYPYVIRSGGAEGRNKIAVIRGHR